MNCNFFIKYMFTANMSQRLYTFLDWFKFHPYI